MSVAILLSLITDCFFIFFLLKTGSILPMLFLNLYAQETLLLGLDMCRQAVQGFILFKNNIKVPWSIHGDSQAAFSF